VGKSWSRTAPDRGALHCDDGGDDIWEDCAYSYLTHTPQTTFIYSHPPRWDWGVYGVLVHGFCMNSWAYMRHCGE